MQLYLIRHPQPQVTPGICYGQTDLGLAEDAAHCARRLLPQLPPDLPCYSSPLQRCRLLAQALHPHMCTDPRLMEMHFGHWEMQPWQQIPRQGLDAWAADPMGFAPPGGESVAQMRQRVLDFLRERQHEPALVLVTHAGVMKLLAGLVWQEPPEVWQGRNFDYASILSLTLDHGLLGA